MREYFVFIHQEQPHQSLDFPRPQTRLVNTIPWILLIKSCNLVYFSGAILIGAFTIRNRAAIIPDAFSLQRRNLDNL